MGDNLPPGVSMNDPDAPWNQDYPEPDAFCMHCGSGYRRNGLYTNNFRIDRWLFIEHRTCPSCGEVVEAQGQDELEPFLEWVRDSPDQFKDLENDPAGVVVELAQAVKRL